MGRLLLGSLALALCAIVPIQSPSPWARFCDSASLRNSASYYSFSYCTKQLLIPPSPVESSASHIEHVEIGSEAEHWWYTRQNVLMRSSLRRWQIIKYLYTTAASRPAFRHALFLQWPCSVSVHDCSPRRRVSHWSWQIFSSILKTLVNTTILQGDMHMASADSILTDPELTQFLVSKHGVESTMLR